MAFEAAGSLLEYARESAEGKQEVTRGIFHSKRCQHAVNALFGLTDMEARGDNLPRSARSAQLLLLILDHPAMALYVSLYLTTRPASYEGAVGVRWLVKTRPTIFETSTNRSYRHVLVDYSHELNDWAATLEADIRSLRLTETMLRGRLIDTSGLSSALLEKVKHIVLDSNSEGYWHTYNPKLHAALHLIRAFRAAPPSFSDENLISSVLELVTNPVASPEIRCLAFSTLAVLLQFTPPSADNALLSQLCLDILLWKTDWQHGIFKDYAVRRPPESNA